MSLNYLGIGLNLLLYKYFDFNLYLTLLLNRLQKLSKMFGNKKNKTTAIVIGAGMRGYGYSYYQRIKPDRFRVHLICELNEC